MAKIDEQIIKQGQDIAEIKTDIQWIKQSMLAFTENKENFESRISKCENYIENIKVKIGLIVAGISIFFTIILNYIKNIIYGGH